MPLSTSISIAAMEYTPTIQLLAVLLLVVCPLVYLIGRLVVLILSYTLFPLLMVPVRLLVSLYSDSDAPAVRREDSAIYSDSEEGGDSDSEGKGGGAPNSLPSGRRRVVQNSR